jgi:hypothetical protein
MKSLLELVIVIGTLVWIGALLWTGFNFISVEAGGQPGLMDYKSSYMNSLKIFAVAAVVVATASFAKKRLTRED